ncbi:MAG: hypothetical protein J6W56_08945, partial [Prevotella sp.]|nr:hypothetical protein [Prevotella sp.]
METKRIRHDPPLVPPSRWIYPVIALIARLFSFSEKKLLKSEIIVVPLLTASKFVLYCLAIVKLLIFSELSKLRSLFYSYFMLNYAG